MCILRYNYLNNNPPSSQPRLQDIRLVCKTDPGVHDIIVENRCHRTIRVLVKSTVA